MPAVANPPVRGFTLSDFDGPDAPADVVPPENDTPPIKPTPAPEPEEKPDDAPPETPTLEVDEDANLNEAMDRQASATKKAEEERVAAENKAAEDAAAAEEAKTTAPVVTRDDDLKVEHAPHVQPKTRKIIDEIKAKTKAARDERDLVIAEREALKKERDELAQKASTTTVPKEAEEELKTLRERVRELDITQDPAIQSKYDAKITANNNSIIGILKSQGFGSLKGEDGKYVENPKAIADLVKQGLTFKTLQPLIAKLEEAGLVDEAETIREGVRENNRIARDRNVEIESWKGNYAQRQQERQVLTKQQQETQAAAFKTQTQIQLKADLEALAKDFTYINQPAAPLATDAPATVKAKQAALEEYNAAAKRIEDAVKTFDTANVPADKLPEVVGRLNASAISGVVLRNHVLPRVIKDMAAKEARIKELEGELDKIRGAGRLSRAQAATPDGANANNGKPDPKSLEEAFGHGPTS